ncbi:MAG: GNAT family N-acetyltransferase [Chloroherpetonaceae bacterium]|nr:GNAT family N-acetyltransferase [Chloroherpetonaceae bacterium]
MKIRIKELQSEAELKVGFPVIRELRGHLSESEFLTIYFEAKKRDDFRIYGAFDETKMDQCLGILSVRTLWDFLHGKHLLIDEVVVSKEARAKGIGSELVRFAESMAVAQGCDMLRASAGVLNELAKHLYEREGWRAKSVAFKKKINKLNEEL